MDARIQQGKLRAGMNLKTVRSTLAGWTEKPVCATLAVDETFYSVRDFTPPIETGIQTVRMFFTDETLTAWGSIVPVS